MKFTDLFKRKETMETDLLVDRLKKEGIQTSITTTVVTTRDRRPANVEKVAIMKDILDMIDEEEVDVAFLELLTLFQKFGFRLQNPPPVLLSEIERKHNRRPPIIP